MTVEAIPMDRAEAQRITERIRLKLDSVAAGMDALGALVADAYQRRADLALGYETWEDARQKARTAGWVRRTILAGSTRSVRDLCPDCVKAVTVR